MGEKKVDLKKDVFNKSEYSNTIPLSFEELNQTTVQDDLENQTTVEDFFQQYNELFYEIPSEGDTNSHEYLVKTSGDYINFNANQEELEALMNEIATLRQENLELEQENANLISSGSI